MTGAGLRERKKQQTKEALVTQGMKLFLARGFEQTTIEEIAAAANVAPRTFFRYFKTKEDLLSVDQARDDQVLSETLASRRPGDDDVSVLGRALLAVAQLTPNYFERSGEMTEVILATPNLKAHVLEEMLRTETLIAEGLVGKRASRAELFRARMLASAAISMFFTVMMTWVESGRRGQVLDLFKPCLDYLRSGFSRK